MNGASVVRWLGADATRMGVMIEAVERDATGRYLNFKAANTSSFHLEPGLLHLLLVMGSALLSGLVAGLMVVGPRGAPEVLGVAMVLPLFSCGVAALIHGVPLLLASDDVPVVGHWPVTARDVGLARLWILLRRTLHVALASAIAPSLVAAGFGSPVVLGGVVVFGASMLQGVLMTVVAALLLFGLRRLLGRRRAQRLATLVGGGLFLAPSILSQLAAASGGPPEWLRGVLPVLTLLPPFTFVSWPMLFDQPVHRAALVVAPGLAVTAGLAWAAVRVVAQTGAAERLEPRRDGDVSRGNWIELLFVPWLPGRRALVARRILAAHLRDDWMTLARVAVVPVQLAVVLVGPFLSGGATSLVADDGGFRIFHLLVAYVAALGVGSVIASVRSGLRPVAWVVAASPASAWDWSGWQRGMARAFTLPFVVPVVIGLHLAAGSSAVRLVDDVLLLVLVHELAIVVGQAVQWRAPFSVPPDFTDGRMIGHVLLLGLFALPALGVWLVFVHGLHVWTPGVTYVLLVVGILGLRRRLGARRMEFV